MTCMECKYSRLASDSFSCRDCLRSSNHETRFFLTMWTRYADGTRTSDNSTLGAWLVMNTVDTYFGGPLHSDLVVDGIVYNYLGMCMYIC
jgi:hypothetical protein